MTQNVYHIILEKNTEYSLRLVLLVREMAKMNVSRTKIRLVTSISPTSVLDRGST